MEHVTGMFKRQLDTWDKSKGFQTRIIGRIREKLEEKIARERNTGVERTMGYSDNLEALRQEFGWVRRRQTPNSFKIRQAVRRIYVARPTRRPGPGRAQ